MPYVNRVPGLHKPSRSHSSDAKDITYLNELLERCPGLPGDTSVTNMIQAPVIIGEKWQIPRRVRAVVDITEWTEFIVRKRTVTQYHTILPLNVMHGGGVCHLGVAGDKLVMRSELFLVRIMHEVDRRHDQRWALVSYIQQYCGRDVLPPARDISVAIEKALHP